MGNSCNGGYENKESDFQTTGTGVFNYKKEVSFYIGL